MVMAAMKRSIKILSNFLILLINILIGLPLKNNRIISIPQNLQKTIDEIKKILYNVVNVVQEVIYNG